MARVIKIDNALQKRFSYKKRNIVINKQLVFYFLIVCEGEKTEPNYFKGFPKKMGKVIYDIQYEGGGISTTKVVEKAIELREKSKQKFDSVWAVFDRDSFKSSLFNSAILKAQSNQIKCAWSNEAFELWYLLHFHNRITSMDRDEYKKAIETAVNDKIGKKKTVFKYKKNDPNMYLHMTKFGNQDLAIKWAKQLNTINQGKNFASYNPSTQVYKLVEELNGNSEEFNNEIIKNYNNGQ